MKMPHKKRKVRKKRGSRTHGYGRIGQHRGSGHRGGHGKAGRDKHKWTYTIKYEPEYFGKHGFKRPTRRKANVINIGELDEKVSRLLSEKRVMERNEGIHIDLHQLGYDKLLGSGQVNHPLVIKVTSYSKSAEEKIKKANGKILHAEN